MHFLYLNALHFIQNPGNTAQLSGKHSAKDFAPEKGSFSMEYFVYFEKIGRISGGKDWL